MTNDQFSLCTSGRGNQTEAARKVLVHGLPVKEMAAHHGIKEQSLRNKIGQIRKRHRMICEAFKT